MKPVKKIVLKKTVKPRRPTKLPKVREEPLTVVTEEIEEIMSSMSEGGFWPYARLEDWKKEHDKVLATGRAFIKAMRAVENWVPKGMRKKKSS